MLSGVVARTAIEDGVRLRFGPDTDAAEVARLAAAEQDCCRFFRFALSIDAHGLALEVCAPAEAIDIVTALFGAPA
jgi:MerR family transcriptional regulator, copper efflux regulator